MGVPWSKPHISVVFWKQTLVILVEPSSVVHVQFAVTNLVAYPRGEGVSLFALRPVLYRRTRS
jgi:hypothetical protein